MERIDLNRQVVGKDGIVRTIKMIKVDGDLEISYNNFIDSYLHSRVIRLFTC